MARVALLVCGGIHPPAHNRQILAAIAADAVLRQLEVIPAALAFPLAPLSAQALRRYLELTLANRGLGSCPEPELMIWAYSAGCVGATALANYWHRYRSRVLALFLVDGWGVPWAGGVPMHRLSHDHITHVTAGWLGRGLVDFEATPAVSHATLWQSPQQVIGQQHAHPSLQSLEAIAPELSWDNISAADFLCRWSRYHLANRQGSSVPGCH